MRRKAGSLVPLEQALCLAAEGLRRRGFKTFHGFSIAKELQDVSDARLLTAYGTLYRALGRLERMGLLASAWGLSAPMWIAGAVMALATALAVPVLMTQQ